MVGKQYRSQACVIYQYWLASPRVLPDQLLIRALIKEIRALAIASSDETTIRRAQGIAVSIIQHAVNIAATRWYEVHGLPIVVVTPHRKRWIGYRRALKLADHFVHPGRVARRCSRFTSRQ